MSRVVEGAPPATVLPVAGLERLEDATIWPVPVMLPATEVSAMACSKVVPEPGAMPVSGLPEMVKPVAGLLMPTMSMFSCAGRPPMVTPPLWSLLVTLMACPVAFDPTTHSPRSTEPGPWGSAAAQIEPVVWRVCTPREASVAWTVPAFSPIPGPPITTPTSRLSPGASSTFPLGLTEVTSPSKEMVNAPPLSPPVKATLPPSPNPARLSPRSSTSPPPSTTHSGLRGPDGSGSTTMGEGAGWTKGWAGPWRTTSACTGVAGKTTTSGLTTGTGSGSGICVSTRSL